MLNIYICDDNKQHLTLIQKYVDNVLLIEQLDMHMELATTDPFQLLEAAKNAANPGLYFLDIELNASISGLKLAQELRRIEPRCFIVFITSHTEMGFLTFHYKVEALGFILKDAPQKIRSEIYDCIMDVNAKYISANTTAGTTFSITLGERTTYVDFDDILFFETSHNVHKVLLHAQNRVIEFSSQLKDVAKQLDDRFYRCHQSYIVNKSKITEIDFKNSILYLPGGETCLISQRKKKGLASCIHSS